MQVHLKYKGTLYWKDYGIIITKVLSAKAIGTYFKQKAISKESFAGLKQLCFGAARVMGKTFKRARNRQCLNWNKSVHAGICTGFNHLAWKKSKVKLVRPVDEFKSPDMEIHSAQNQISWISLRGSWRSWACSSLYLLYLVYFLIIFFCGGGINPQDCNLFLKSPSEKCNSQLRLDDVHSSSLSRGRK